MNVAILPGDGIGPEVIAQGVRVMRLERSRSVVAVAPVIMQMEEE